MSVWHSQCSRYMSSMGQLTVCKAALLAYYSYKVSENIHQYHLCVTGADSLFFLFTSWIFQKYAFYSSDNYQFKTSQLKLSKKMYFALRCTTTSPFYLESRHWCKFTQISDQAHLEFLETLESLSFGSDPIYYTCLLFKTDKPF